MKEGKRLLALIPIFLFAMIGKGFLYAQTGQEIRIVVPPIGNGMGAAQVQVINSQDIPRNVQLRFLVQAGSMDSRLIDRNQVVLQPGVNEYPVQWEVIRQAQLGSGNPSAIPTLCIEVYGLEGRLLGNNCQPITSFPSLPVQLVLPYNKEEVASLTPLFTWTPPVFQGESQGLSYRLKVVEKPPHLSAEAAIQRGAVRMLTDLLRVNSYPYPAGAQALETGQTYAWQVSVFFQGRFLSNSEVWTFRLPSSEAQKVPQEEPITYVELSQSIGSGYYPAREKLGFRFDRPYTGSPLSFKIYDVKANTIASREVILKQVKDNLFELSLPMGAGLIPGTLYTLEVRDEKGHPYYLRFLYQYDF